MGFKVWGLGFGVGGSGFGVWVSRFGVQSLEFTVWGLRSGVGEFKVSAFELRGLEATHNFVTLLSSRSGKTNVALHECTRAASACTWVILQIMMQESLTTDRRPRTRCGRQCDGVSRGTSSAGICRRFHPVREHATLPYDV